MTLYGCMCDECAYDEDTDYIECECGGIGCEQCEHEGGWWFETAMSRQEFERQARAVGEDA